MSKAIVFLRDRHEKCKEVYRLREQEGLGSTTISRLVEISEPTVKRWLANPTRYDPYFDEVALSRAVDGDREVYLNLNYWERAEFFRRLAHTRRGLGYSWRYLIGDLAEKLRVNTDHFAENVSAYDDLA